jgi:hypothetical protein
LLFLPASPAASSDKSVSLSYSGTITSTWYCDGPLYTGVTVDFDGEAVGAPLGRGTLGFAFGAGRGGGPGAWTFTDRSGANTLTGVAALYVANSPEGPLVGNNLSVTSGTGNSPM